MAAQHSPANSVVPLENPYEIYQLRAPCERASAIVPHRLIKQPEVSWTRSKYRRIPEAKRPRNRSRSSQTLRSTPQTDSLPFTHNNNHATKTSAAQNTSPCSMPFRSSRPSTRSDKSLFRHLEHSKSCKDPPARSLNLTDSNQVRSDFVTVYPTNPSHSYTTTVHPCQVLDPRLTLDHTFFNYDADDCDEDHFDDDESSGSNLRVATLGSADLSFRDNNYPRPFSMPSRVSQLDGFTSDEESTLSSVPEYPLPSMRSSCRSSMDILASGPPSPSPSAIAHQTRAFRSRTDSHGTLASRGAPSPLRATADAKRSASGPTTPAVVLDQKGRAVPFSSGSASCSVVQDPSHSALIASHAASRNVGFTSRPSSDQNKIDAGPESFSQNMRANMPNVPEPVPELRILPMASDGTFTRTDPYVLSTSPVTPRPSQDHIEAIGDSQTVYKDRQALSPRSAHPAIQVDHAASTARDCSSTMPSNIASTARCEEHFANRRRASAASDAQRVVCSQQSLPCASEALVLSNALSRRANKVHVPVSNVQVDSRSHSPPRDLNLSNVSKCIPVRKHSGLQSIGASPARKRKQYRNCTSSSSASVTSGISHSYEDSANVAQARTWSGYEHVPIQHQRQPGDYSKSRSGFLARFRSGWSKLTHRGIL